MSVDPLADKYPGLSSYNYCLNNPLSFNDPDGMDTTKANQPSSGAAIIEPLPLVKQITEKLAISFIDGAMNGIDEIGQTLSDGSTYGIIGSGIAGFVFEPAWAAIPYFAAAGTVGDGASAAAKTGKALIGTGTYEDAALQTGTAVANLALGKVANIMTGNLAQMTTFIRRGQEVTVYKDAVGKFISSSTAKSIGVMFNLTVAQPVSLSVSISLDKLKK